MSLDGERHYFSLGLQRKRAIKLDRELRQLLRQGEEVTSIGRWLSVQSGRRPNVLCGKDGRPRIRKHGLTVGDVVHAHQQVYLEAKPQTTYRYRASLVNLVETALRHRRGLEPITRTGLRVTLHDYGAILDVPLTRLDDNLVADFKAARLSAVTRSSPAERSAKISANTELRQARCVFSGEAKLAYKRVGLDLPDLAAFMAAPRFMRVHGRPQPPCDAIVTQVFAALRELAENNEDDIFTVVSLALFAGLRRGEILHAERHWLQETSGPSVVVRLREDFCTKNYGERTIPIPPWLYGWLLTRQTESSFLLAGNERERKRTLDRAIRWLRDRGMAALAKPLHTLRALYAGFLLATETSLVRVKSRLGHADLTTTFRYYADEPLSPKLTALWHEPMAFPRASTGR